ncbi:hypothetical protein PENTCL1PPCAC_8125, partial [Pristionchus entomophagus]
QRHKRLAEQDDTAPLKRQKPIDVDEVTASPGLSLLEALPRELIRNIIEHVPEAVLDLRLTSQLIKSCVDEIATHATIIPLAKGISLIGTIEDKSIELGITVSTFKSHLFELRLKLQLPHPDLMSLLERKTEKPYAAEGEVAYILPFNALDYDVSLLDHLKYCIGNWVYEVELLEFEDRAISNAI